MINLADVGGFKLFIQVCMWPRFPPLKVAYPAWIPTKPVPFNLKLN